jgi:hypothetical protein
VTYAATNPTTSAFSAQVRFSRPFNATTAGDINITDGSALNLNIFYTVLPVAAGTAITVPKVNDTNDLAVNAVGQLISVLYTAPAAPGTGAGTGSGAAQLLFSAVVVVLGLINFF